MSQQRPAELPRPPAEEPVATQAQGDEPVAPPPPAAAPVVEAPAPVPELALEPSPRTEPELLAEPEPDPQPEALVAPGSETVAAPTPRDPAADYADGLAAGAGAPLVAGPPSSVDPPVPAQGVNTFFGIAAIVLLVATVLVVILLAVFVVKLLTSR